MTSHYVRVAANVSDNFHLDEAKAVAFTTPQTEPDVVAFVDEPGNYAAFVVDMVDLNTGRSLNGETTQANVATCLTHDASGNPITDGLYYTYIVTKNRGGHRDIQTYIIYPTLMYEMVPRSYLYVRSENSSSGPKENAFDNNYISSAWTAGQNLAYNFVWLDLEREYIISKFRLWQNNNVVHSRDLIHNFKMIMTNTAPSSYSNDRTDYSGHFMDSKNLKSNGGWYYTDNSGNYNPTNVLGRETDPTLSLQKSNTTGFHEFRFDDSIAPSNRTGQYCYIELDRSYNSGVPTVAELKMFGYETN